MANNRPIGFEGQMNSGQQQQPPYGYPPMNAAPDYGIGYGAAYPPPAAGDVVYPPVEAYQLERTPSPHMPKFKLQRNGIVTKECFQPAPVKNMPKLSRNFS
eukprot:Seg7863.1 transcript_id=Seg7863.1/GoldUCD/mRNA.D3Y31 product="hypothetical protein" protein_id=Seg7863.1/GoldUCD/D3Y31